MAAGRIRLLACLLFPLLIGGISGFLTRNDMGAWFQALAAPSFKPPDWIFGPVWTLLYLLMGFSFYKIMRAAPSEKRTLAFLVFLLQLTLNFAWSILFFKFRLIGFAFIDILLLLISIVMMIRVFYAVDKQAALLQLPYLLWVSFASVLNGAYWYLNL